MTNTDTQFLQRPDGRIAYSVNGSGPLVITSPGMGDIRQAYRFFSPALREAGFRVVDMDLRGHGDSDTAFAAYGDTETGSDMLALIEELGEPAVIVGNSMSAGAAVWAAVEAPDLVRGVVMLGPFVRDPKTSPLMRGLMQVMLWPPLAALSWNAYLPSLYAGTKPDDFSAYRKDVVHALRRPGYARAFSRTARLSHAVAEARLSRMASPTLVIMGEQDPDFADPASEADWIAQQTHANVSMIPDAGHYPHSQRPELVVSAVETFLKGLDNRA